MLIADIHIEGKSSEDVLLALEDVTRKLREGYTSGFDRNDDGRYYFDLVDKEDAKEADRTSG